MQAIMEEGPPTSIRLSLQPDGSIFEFNKFIKFKNTSIRLKRQRQALR
jgi:hypothetical protein